MSELIELIPESKNYGIRIDKYISENTELTRSAVQGLLEK